MNANQIYSAVEQHALIWRNYRRQTTSIRLKKRSLVFAHAIIVESLIVPRLFLRLLVKGNECGMSKIIVM